MIDLLPADTAPDARALFERMAAEPLPGSIPLASVAAAERLLAVLEEQREPILRTSRQRQAESITL